MKAVLLSSDFDSAHEPSSRPSRIPGDNHFARARFSVSIFEFPISIFRLYPPDHQLTVTVSNVSIPIIIGFGCRVAFTLKLRPGDWPVCADWCWDCGDDFVVYEDTDHVGWYLFYNVHTGVYVHVSYMGT